MASQWFVRGGGKVFGPLDDARLRKLAVDGKIDETTDVAMCVSGPWHPAARVKGLFPPKAIPPKVAGEPPRAPISATELPAVTPAVSLAELHDASPLFESNQAELNGIPTTSTSVESGDDFIPSMPFHRPTKSSARLCPTCGNACAVNARSCPQCGYRFPSNLPYVVAGILILLLVGGGIAAAVIRKQREEAQIWRDVFRQNDERQERLRRELDDAWDRLLNR